MSFFDDASLAFLPSGAAGKDGKAYSIKPTDGTGDFTFSRGSNLSATRIGSDGLIEKGRENLLLQSNNFGTSWTILNITQTSGQSGYDGTNDAWQSSFTAGSTRAFGQSFSQTGVITISIYVKAGTHDFIQFVTSTSTTAYVNFDISSSSAAVGTEGSGVIDSSITSVGGDWYRCSMSFNNTKSGTIYAWMIDSATSPRASVVSTAGTIYIQDAQVEIGLAATDYIESGASTGKAGLLEDEPRFDYSGGAACPSLLLEPNRTNLAGKSEYIGGWGFPTNVTLTQNYGISPEGLTNSTRLQFTSNGFMNDALSQVNGTQYTLSIYAKRNDGGTQSFGFYVNGTPTIVGGITLTSDWQRFTYTYTASNSFSIGLAGNSGADVSVYGFQCEAGSYPTSYIPNHSGGTITRGEDNPAQLDVTGLTSTYNTLYAEFEVSSITNQGKISLSDNSSNNRMTIYQNQDDLLLLLNTGGSSQTIITASNALSVGTNYKVVVKNQNGSHALFINGTKIGQENSTTPTGLNKLRYGNEISINSTQKFLGDIKQTLLFPEALSDADCITLTTI